MSAPGHYLFNKKVMKGAWNHFPLPFPTSQSQGHIFRYNFVCIFYNISSPDSDPSWDLSGVNVVGDDDVVDAEDDVDDVDRYA